MLKGIDISNWQNGLNLNKVKNIDFCIVKATEGLNFVDYTCDGFVQTCIKKGMPWAFYHFAKYNDPLREAEFFVKACENYFGDGIPVLDYEVENWNDKLWCEQFITRVHDLTGIWCMLYTSASWCAKFKDSWIANKCALWVAGYPYPMENWPDGGCPYDCTPWKRCTIWQFTDCLLTYFGNIDGDIAYISIDEWVKYAQGKISNATEKQETAPAEKGKTCEELAQEVLQGKWGNGWNRQQALDAAYGVGTYDHVQCIVNQLMGLDGC